MNDEQKIINQLQNSPDFRKELTRNSFYWFFATYFSHYITCPTAKFQREIIKFLEDPLYSKVAITAFRGSAKSTIATLAYPIWAMIGKPNKKYILLISQTQELSKQILTNIKQELTTNELLVRDFGSFIESADEWRSNSLVDTRFETRVSAISQSESIRGLRHKQYRPDLIIIDDVEDLESVKNKEGRDKLWDWLSGEVMPIGDMTTKMVVVGNLLHEDSLMMRLKESISTGKMGGVYRAYPLIYDDGTISWPGKYPTFKEIDEKRKQVADDSAWFREYLLKFISDDRRIVQKAWIKHYEILPDRRLNPPRILAIGTDLAISQKNTADFTSLVPIYVTGYGDDLRIYILPYIINKRMNFTDTIKEIKKLSKVIEEDYKRPPTVFVEKVAYQESLVHQLTLEKVLAEAVGVEGMNKQTRLEMATPYIRLQKVLFPPRGAEQLEGQIVNFGIEKHDDLADAFTLSILKVLLSDRPTYKSNYQPSNEPPKPRYIDIGTGPINISEPFFSLDMKF